MTTKRENTVKDKPTGKEMFAGVKVGDKVWDIRMGWGVVIAVGHYYDYPLVVGFEPCSKSYTLEGYYHKNDLNPSLFWGEIEINTPAKPLPKLEVDTKVVVWDSDGRKYNRHFSHFDEEGRLFTFAQGQTSFSSESNLKVWVTGWDNWKLAE